MKKHGYILKWILAAAALGAILAVAAPALLGIVLLLGALAVFYGLAVWAARISGTAQIIKKLTVKEKVISLILLIAVLFFVYFQVRQEHFIYYWDYAGYWQKSLLQMKRFLLYPVQSLLYLIRSANFEEYNLFPATIMALPLRLFGSSFTSYVMLIFSMFILPTCVLMAALVRKAALRLNIRALPFPAILGICLLFPILYLPALYGYIDSICLLSAVSCLSLQIGWDYRTLDKKRCIATALLLLETVLLRRYFAYWALGFLFAWLLIFCFQLLKEQDKRAFAVGFVKNAALAGTACASVLLICFPVFVYRSVFVSYGEAYSAYAAASFGASMKEYFSFIGASGLLCAVVLPIGLLLVYPKARESLIVPLAHIAVSFLLFGFVQQMDVHHYYILALQMMFLCGLSLSLLAHTGSSHKIVSLAGIGLATLLAVNFAACFFPLPQTPLFTQERYHPRVRGDISVIRQMADELQQLSQDGGSIYVLASSEILNDDIIRQASLPDQMNYPYALEKSNHVDLRDGFPMQFFTSSIVLVASPAQYHLRPQDQQVIGVLAEEMSRESSPIRKRFVFYKSYPLDGGVKADLYLKQSEFDQDDILYLKQIFQDRYPNHPELFSDRFDQFLSGATPPTADLYAKLQRLADNPKYRLLRPIIEWMSVIFKDHLY